ncbi:serine/threonine protein kinase [Neorhizobium galegae]|uniref:serine/threonine-protein kinase n=1 Tax=Neorhizobium galegae TaxID=399 RepID=UPI0021085319|nr:serine/threonine-protein kinase [Neorhizobium galegae]MCQ1769556.1 serine/threonine protein kinase [Neorhizobium galegae]MCQ1849605.1 serine/threonine protein kinase [Neorhizobium galegae]
MTQLVPVSLVPGMNLYKYRLTSRIGAGSFGEVWLAHDLAIQREYAIKILQPGVSVDQRLREAQIGNRLEHNNLVYVHQADVVPVAGEHVVILAMDFQPHGSVEGLANAAGYLPLPAVLRIARDILQGLEYLHARNFYHNDIKPGNILLGPQGQAMLSDYGITGVSSNGAPVAAPNAYVLHRAPEVLATGNIGVSSDIFQVGMTLARLLIHLDHLRAIRSSIGPAQYEQEIAAGSLLEPQDFGCHIPAAVRRVVLRAMHPDQSQRYSSALEMRRALEKLDYPGYWTVDGAGNEVGISRKHEFSYSVSPAIGGKFDVTCSKRNTSSGNSQRITQFCKRGLNQKTADKVVAGFKQFVVTGK